MLAILGIASTLAFAARSADVVSTRVRRATADGVTLCGIAYPAPAEASASARAS